MILKKGAVSNIFHFGWWCIMQYTLGQGGPIKPHLLLLHRELDHRSSCIGPMQLGMGESQCVDCMAACWHHVQSTFALKLASSAWGKYFPLFTPLFMLTLKKIIIIIKQCLPFSSQVPYFSSLILKPRHPLSIILPLSLYINEFQIF